MESQKIHDGFLRARRFLFASSLALSLVYSVGLQFKTINFLGNNAEISHPGRIIIFLWLIWVWAYLQYVVWFRDLEVNGEVRKAIRDVVAQILNQKVKRRQPDERFKKILIRNLANKYDDPDPQVGEGYMAQNSGRITYWQTITRVDVRDPVPKSATLIVHALICILDTSRTLDTEHNESIEISAGDWRWMAIAAAIWVFFTRRFLLEYWAPFVVGLLPLYAWYMQPPTLTLLCT